MATDVEIIEADWTEYDAGCDLLDSDDALIETLGDAFKPNESQVEHGVYDTIHGKGTLAVARELVWGSQRLRPWFTVTDAAGNQVRRNLGVFIPATPERNPRETPQTYVLSVFDKLEVLNHPHGSSYTLNAGDAILDAVRALITAAGETAILIDSAGDAKVQATTKVWPIAEDVFTLHIVNDMLDSVGYRGLWCDRDGYYRSEPYVAPSSLAPMWVYDAQSPRTTVGEDRTEQADYFRAPNRWVFVLDDPDATIPVEGAGIYTVVNVADGPTSINARGRTITSVVKLDAADQASLVVQGDRVVERDKRVDRRVDTTVAPNPLHGHFDVVTFADSGLGPTGNMLVTNWMLPLSGEDMELSLKAV